MNIRRVHGRQSFTGLFCGWGGFNFLYWCKSKLCWHYFTKDLSVSLRDLKHGQWTYLAAGRRASNLAKPHPVSGGFLSSCRFTVVNIGETSNVGTITQKTPTPCLQTSSVPSDGTHTHRQKRFWVPCIWYVG